MIENNKYNEPNQIIAQLILPADRDFITSVGNQHIPKAVTELSWDWETSLLPTMPFDERKNKFYILALKQ